MDRVTELPADAMRCDGMERSRLRIEETVQAALISPMHWSKSHETFVNLASQDVIGPSNRTKAKTFRVDGFFF